MSKTTSSILSDEELIARICLADPSAFKALYKQYFPRLFRFIYRVTHSLEGIEEIINDVMFVVWNKAATFNFKVKVSTWIFGIAYNKCLKELASRSKMQSLVLEDIAYVQSGNRIDSLLHLEIDDWLASVFSQLPPEQRAVLELTYREELSYSEIAKIMACPENTVKTRMFHARKKIKSLYPDLAMLLESDFYGKTL